MRRSSAVLAVSAVVAAAAIALPSVATDTSHGDIQVISVVVNNGRTIVLGTRQRLTFPVSVTATDDSGIKSVSPIGLWGPKQGILKVTGMTCRPDSATTSTCTGTATVDTGKHQVWNDEAGTWFVDAQANANDGDKVINGTLGGFSVKRLGRMRIYPAPARVAPGQPVTVHGWLSRAWWDTGDYHGSPDDQVQLMFRPDGGSTWTTVGTQTTNALGQVAATVRPDRSGSYQWYFPGSKWTSGASSGTVHVTVG